MVEQRHGRSPVLLRPRSAAAASRSAATSSLATGWSWLVMPWAMLPGLMNLTRMSASGGMEIGYHQLTANSRVRCPGIKKSGPLQCHRGFYGWTCQGPELNFYVTRLPQNKNAGRPFGARHRLHRPSPGPARPAARAPLPSPHGARARPRVGRHASREKPGTGPHDTAGRHGTRRRGPHARAGNPVVGPACSSGA